MTDRLDGRFALITGGSRGIGRAVAEHFAGEGATVAVAHRGDRVEAEATLERLAALGPGRAHLALEADVADAGAVERLFEEVNAAWGRLDILVNNAGIQSPTPGDSFDEEELRRILAVDLVGAALCARAALRAFLGQPSGAAGCSIVNTSSVHELIPKPTYLAYSMAKGGLGNLTRTLALEFADRGVRVNAVAPGAVLTSLNDAWRHDAGARAAVEGHIPMGRAATPEEIAPAFTFLASDEARYVTGQTLYVDGGLTLYNDFRVNWSS
jgi:glucose 1-dehydrogenase